MILESQQSQHTLQRLSRPIPNGNGFNSLAQADRRATRDSHFIAYWRAAEAALNARRWPSLPMGRAHLYWLVGFTAEQAADAEILKGRV